MLVENDSENGSGRLKDSNTDEKLPEIDRMKSHGRKVRKTKLDVEVAFALIEAD